MASERLTVGVAARLSRYLQVLTQTKKMGRDAISSQEIAEYTHINATQIRRDLSGFGKFGKRGVGYNVDALIGEIRKILRAAGQHNIAVFGAGPPGRGDRPLRPVRRPRLQHRRAVRHRPREGRAPARRRRGARATTTSTAAIRERNIIVGVLAVPDSAAQGVADRLVDNGVRIIFNYTGALLTVPADVTVHTSSPIVELLYALYFYLA